jgi:hypothetical protein
MKPDGGIEPLDSSTLFDVSGLEDHYMEHRAVFISSE